MAIARDVDDCPVDLRGVSQDELFIRHPPLQPEQALAARVGLAERDETESCDECEQRRHDRKADEQLRAERQWDASNRAHDGVVGGPKTPLAPRLRPPHRSTRSRRDRTAPSQRSTRRSRTK
jgi:hypothetical protein